MQSREEGLQTARSQTGRQIRTQTLWCRGAQGGVRGWRERPSDWGRTDSYLEGP